MGRRAAAIALLSAAVVMTAFRLPAWQDDRHLWQAAMETTPENPRAAFNLAVAYGAQQQWFAACQWLQRATLLLQPPAYVRARAVIGPMIRADEQYVSQWTPCD